jgi:hypothetical protein
MLWPDGELKWEDGFDNLVTTEGKNDIIDKYFKGSAYTAAWYLGLKGTGSAAVGDTLASPCRAGPSHAIFGNRPAITFGTTSAGQHRDGGQLLDQRDRDRRRRHSSGRSTPARQASSTARATSRPLAQRRQRRHAERHRHGLGTTSATPRIQLRRQRNVIHVTYLMYNCTFSPRSGALRRALTSGAVL